MILFVENLLLGHRLAHTAERGTLDLGIVSSRVEFTLKKKKKKEFLKFLKKHLRSRLD